MDDLLDLLGMIFFVAVLFTVLILGPIIGACYYSSCRQANIYNAQHNTNWTCSDFFWASEQINQSTKTINVTGVK
jgi:hypothetical protein